MRERGAVLLVHATLAAWLVVVLYSATYLIAPPSDSVVRLGIVVILAITGWSALLSLIVGSPLVRVPAAVLGAAVATVAVVYPPSRRDGRSHPEAIADDLASWVTAIRRDVPPIEAEPLWGAIVVLLIAVVAIATLVIAVDAVGTFEALVPGTAFVVIVLTVASRSPALYSGLVIALGVVALAVLTTRRRRPGRPAAVGAALGRVPAVFGLAATVATVGVVTGPLLPGADRDAWIDLRSRSTGVTTILSPLVDIRTRLTSSSETLMFTVESATDSYWRIASLPEFDGTTFRLPAAPLTTPPRIDRSSEPITQRIDIAALGGRLVPAAPDPIALSPGLRWNADTDSVVLVDRDLEPGDRFEIASIRPLREPQALDGATSQTGPISTRLLPDGFPVRIVDTALEVTADASNDYERALALQFWFREQFEYSLDAPAGHGIDSIERFLAVRRGYCEQFATAYAAMGRGIGLATRVAVGFTSGIAVDGRYEVRGRHAHAWPEVWFDGVGWVPFEPTPGRGAPGAEQYTGVAPAQDAAEPTVDDAAAEAPAEPDSAAGDDDFSLTIPNDVGPASAAPPTDEAGSIADLRWPALIAVGVIGLVIAPIIRRRFNRRRWTRARPDDQVLEIWETARRTLRRAGIAGDPATTNQQWASLVRRAMPAIDRSITSLAAAVDEMVYSSRPAAEVGVYGMSIGRASMSWWRQIHAFVATESGWRWRVVDYWVRPI